MVTNPMKSILVGLQAGMLCALALIFVAPTPRDLVASWWAPSTDSTAVPVVDPARVQALTRRLDRRIPAGPYLVVSSTDNTFRLMKGTGVMREGTCSTGSYVLLKAGNDREWLFNTPRGVRRIESKRTKPVWVKPDWAFIEMGEPVPAAGSSLRYERGVLGDYALSMGDGYLVHGTPYQRLLGLPVSHGCIRLGDADLEAVYGALPVGAPVYIY